MSLLGKVSFNLFYDFLFANYLEPFSKKRNSMIIKEAGIIGQVITNRVFNSSSHIFFCYYRVITVSAS